VGWCWAGRASFLTSNGSAPLARAAPQRYVAIAPLASHQVVPGFATCFHLLYDWRYNTSREITRDLSASRERGENGERGGYRGPRGWFARSMRSESEPAPELFDADCNASAMRGTKRQGRGRYRSRPHEHVAGPDDSASRERCTTPSISTSKRIVDRPPGCARSPRQSQCRGRVRIFLGGWGGVRVYARSDSGVPQRICRP